MHFLDGEKNYEHRTFFGAYRTNNRFNRWDLENFSEKCVPEVFWCVPDENLTVWT